MYFAFLTGSELLLVLLAVVVLFGATRLPQLGASLGQGIRNFREAVSGKDQPPTQIEDGKPANPNAKKDDKATPEPPKANPS